MSKNQSAAVAQTRTHSLKNVRTLVVSAVLAAISVVLALIVMYDAANVRKETGNQAKVLNYMMENWANNKPELFAKDLKELIGHTWLQVVMGAILGVIVGLVGCALWP